MIKLANEMRSEVKKEMRGGSGEVKLTHIFEQSELQGHSRLVAKVTIEPGCSVGLHEHVEEEEIYYILKGQAEVTDDQTTQLVGPGDAILTGGGKSHAIKNVGEDSVEFVAVILTY